MRNVLTKVALASAALIGLSSSANAFVVVSLADFSNPGSLVSCNTQTLVCDAGFTILTPDNVIFNGTVGNFTVQNSSGTNNYPGTPDEAYVTASTTNVINTAAVITGLDELYVNVRSFGFTLPADEEKTFFGAASMSSTDPGTGGTVRSRFTADPNNGGAIVNAIECTMAVVASNNCNTGAPIIWQDLASPGSLPGFSIRTEQYFRLEGGSRAGSTSTATVGTIPEPMTTSLVGGALLALALSSRRRSAKGKA